MSVGFYVDLGQDILSTTRRLSTAIFYWTMNIISAMIFKYIQTLEERIPKTMPTYTGEDELIENLRCKITPEQRLWLEDQAQQSRRSMGSVVRGLIEQAMCNRLQAPQGATHERHP